MRVPAINRLKITCYTINTELYTNYTQLYPIPVQLLTGLNNILFISHNEPSFCKKRLLDHRSRKTINKLILFCRFGGLNCCSVQYKRSFYVSRSLFLEKLLVIPISELLRKTSVHFEAEIKSRTFGDLLRFSFTLLLEGKSIGKLLCFLLTISSKLII